jgi:hypothetical protein
MLLHEKVDFFQKVIMYLAEAQYQEEVVDAYMENELIGSGPNCTYATKKQWLTETIECWFEETKIHFNIIKLPKDETSKLEDDKKIEPVINFIKNRFYNMNIGDTFDWDNFTTVIRVPGGWVFDTNDGPAYIPFVSSDSSLV